MQIEDDFISIVYEGSALESHLKNLPAEAQNQLKQVFSGERLPELYSDIIAKSVFNPDAHPERLNFLLSGLAVDDTIDIRSSAGNEGIHQSLNAKGLITDIPAWLQDGRLADLEIQKVQQDFILTRMELYASNMLLLQYSVESGHLKSELNYKNVKDVVVAVLMVNSPKVFQEFGSENGRYIHRFHKMIADSGFSYPASVTMIYVQLDKCLAQFRNGENAESEDGKPDRLQVWLSTIADVNDTQVVQAAEKDPELRRIRTEMHHMAQNREVQNMILQEQFERMDWATHINQSRSEGLQEGRKEGRKEGLQEGQKKGQEKLGSLIELLFSQGRTDDARRVANDEQYREELYKEFHIE